MLVLCGIRSGPAAALASPTLYPCHDIARLQPGRPCGLVKYLAIYIYNHYSIILIHVSDLSNQLFDRVLSSTLTTKYRFSNQVTVEHCRGSRLNQLPRDASRDATLDLGPGMGTACLSTDCKREIFNLRHVRMPRGTTTKVWWFVSFIWCIVRLGVWPG